MLKKNEIDKHFSLNLNEFLKIKLKKFFRCVYLNERIERANAAESAKWKKSWEK